MHKISLVLIACLTFSINLMAQSDISKARWKSKEIIIDGNDREWAKPLNFYDDKSGVLFAICNDTKNVYLAFTVKDEMNMWRLISAGWSVELSSKEKDRRFNATLTFPAVKITGMGKQPGSEFEKKVPGNPVIDSYRAQLKSVAVNGFLSNQTAIKLNEHDSIDIAIGADSSRLIVYEIAIPLKELMPDSSIQLDELITLSVAVNALARPSGSGDRSARSGGEMLETGGGMSGEMGGGGPGGRMGGGRPGGMPRGGGYSSGGPGNGNDSFPRVSFKQKFILAKE